MTGFLRLTMARARFAGRCFSVRAVNDNGCEVTPLLRPANNGTGWFADPETAA